ncbi:MAG: amidase [Chitinophagales bacterium]
MKRRNFMKNASLAGLSISILPLQGAVVKEPQLPPLPPSFLKEFELNEMTIEGLQKKMQDGEFTSRAITELYLKRIAEIDQSGPHINSVIELNPDALAIADKMDGERKISIIRGPLHGIPILIKDNINTSDKMMTTAGSLALVGNMVNRDAFIIEQLRNAGAVILGKTNLSEWANFRSTRSSSGWSSRGGQTKNPCVLDRNPCGSSSGSGAAVAANFCAVAVGTETNGSIIAPASFCGIVGLKPTVGLISRTGIIPISETQDTAGPMGRTVKDVAILLGAMAGTDENDLSTKENSGKIINDYTKLLNTDALKGKRIGIERKFLNGHEGVVELYKRAIEELKLQGATVIEIDLLNKYDAMSDAAFTVLKYEFKDGLNRYLANANAKVKSLSDVIEFNNKNKDVAMPYFKQEILEASNELGGLNSKEYFDALLTTTSSKQIINSLMAENKLDAICGTTIGLAGCTDLVNGDYDTGFYFGTPAALAGFPHITVPMGKVHELPVGFSFMAGAFKEADILAMAYAFEQATNKREMPKFLKSVG